MDVESQISFGTKTSKDTRPTSILQTRKENNKTTTSEDPHLKPLVKFNFPLDSVFRTHRTKVNPNHDLIRKHSPYLNTSLLVDPEMLRKKKVEIKPTIKSRLTRISLD